MTVQEEAPAACAECGSAELTRETDVLDTWFSAALWPFATLGWPDDTPDLKTFYPGSLNTTARDIIRLWENRMIFSGLEMMGDAPFSDVVIHSLVHAPSGGRMSKSLGTGMNPLALIDEHGADATRYGLMKMASSQDVTFSEGAIEEGRKLANKLWNASRLLIQAGVTELDERPSSLEERWILARLSATQVALEDYLARFDFSHLVAELYHLTFDDFCDWYLEAIKPRIYGGDTDALATAGAALERLLKLLHPVMPHVTEEIWSNLPGRESRLIVAPWPETGDTTEADALVRVQEAAERFRRSGVPTPLEDDEKRIFDAVVKPGHVEADGNVEVERGRLRKEIERAEKMLDNPGFTSMAPAEVVEAEREKLERYRRELDALGG
jgi:valyl-tRNA synthetase